MIAHRRLLPSSALSMAVALVLAGNPPQAGVEKQPDVPTPRVVPTVMPALAGEYPRFFIYDPVAFSAATRQYARGVTQSGDMTAFLGDNGVRAQGSPDTMRVWGERR